MDKLFVFTLLLIFSSCDGNAQSRQDYNTAFRFFNDAKIDYSWRNGEAVYGTYNFCTHYFCPDGQWAAYCNSEKTTILDNIQRNRWEVHGRWELVAHGGEVKVKTTYQNGNYDYTLLNIYNNGQISLKNGTNIIHRGRSGCN